MKLTITLFFIAILIACSKKEHYFKPSDESLTQEVFDLLLQEAGFEYKRLEDGFYSVNPDDFERLNVISDRASDKSRRIYGLYLEGECAKQKMSDYLQAKKLFFVVYKSEGRELVGIDRGHVKLHKFVEYASLFVNKCQGVNA